MYADDVKLCLSHNDIASGFNLQSDIDCFQDQRAFQRIGTQQLISS